MSQRMLRCRSGSMSQSIQCEPQARRCRCTIRSWKKRHGSRLRRLRRRLWPAWRCQRLQSIKAPWQIVGHGIPAAAPIWGLHGRPFSHSWGQQIWCIWRHNLMAPSLGVNVITRKAVVRNVPVADHERVQGNGFDPQHGCAQTSMHKVYKSTRILSRFGKLLRPIRPSHGKRVYLEKPCSEKNGFKD